MKKINKVVEKIIYTLDEEDKKAIRRVYNLLDEIHWDMSIDDTIEIAVQINGKTKGTLEIGRDDAKDDVIARAKETIKDKLTGNIVKEIYVPGRIVNIVMK